MVKKLVGVALCLSLCSCGSVKYNRVHVVDSGYCYNIVSRHGDRFEVTDRYGNRYVLNLKNVPYYMVAEGSECPSCSSK